MVDWCGGTCQGVEEVGRGESEHLYIQSVPYSLLYYSPFWSGSYPYQVPGQLHSPSTNIEPGLQAKGHVNSVFTASIVKRTNSGTGLVITVQVNSCTS